MALNEGIVARLLESQVLHDAGPLPLFEALRRFGAQCRDRSLVKAVYLANKTTRRTGVKINLKKLVKAKLGAGVGTSILDAIDSYRGELRPFYESVELIAGNNIWLPGVSYVSELKKAGDITTRNAVLNKAVEITKGAGGFIVGIVEGFAKSIVDVITGLIDLIGGAIKAVSSIITGEAIDIAKDIIDKLSSLSASELKALGLQLIQSIGGFIVSAYDKFITNWNQPNAFDRWHFRGVVVGYILAEIVMIIFTGAIANAIKWVSKLGKVGGKLAQLLNKILPKIKKFLPKRKKSTIPDIDAPSKGKGKKARQLPIALVIASGIAELHDKKDSPLPVVIAALKPLMLKFKWIRRSRPFYLSQDPSRALPDHHACQRAYR